MGAAAPIEIGSMGVAHPKNWPNTNSHKCIIVLFDDEK